MPRAASHRHTPDVGPRAADPPPPDQFMFDRQSVRDVDRLAVEEYAMPGVVLMENAARGSARVAMEMLAGALASNRSPRVRIICGPGNNGGDGYAIARLLHNEGCAVIIHPLGTPKPGTDAAVNRTICEHMKLAITPLAGPDDLRDTDLIIDAVLGTGLSSEVKGEPADVIAWINQANRPVLAIDLPSGMDCDTGEPFGICVRATRTVTFVGEKKGFQSLDAQKLLGEVSVVDIGVPKELVERKGTKASRHRGTKGRT